MKSHGLAKFMLIAVLMPLLQLLPSPATCQNRKLWPLPRPGVPQSLGVNIHFTDPRTGEMPLLAAAGFRWIRMDLGWEGIEQVKGKYDFSAYDRLMVELKPYSIRPLFILDYGNKLYEKDSPRSPEARAAFARFAAAVVTHFKDQGALWEMWNEPNGGFWKPTANVDEYIALALETGRAIRKAAPQEYYIGPATSGMDFTFMERCFKAGLLQYWDAVSFHPYRETAPETAAPDFDRIKEMIAKHAPSGKRIPILSGEWGYSELYPHLNLQLQSKYIAREFLTNMANGLILSIWYDWHDDGEDPKEAEHHFGTVYTDYKMKPTYVAARTLARTLDGLRFNKRLALDSPTDYCLLFSNGSRNVRLAVWTTDPKPHAVTLPIGATTNPIQQISYLGEKSIGTPAADGLRVTLTDSPQYIVVGNDPLLRAAAAWSTAPNRLIVKDHAEAQRALSQLTTGEWPTGSSAAPARLTVSTMGSETPHAAGSTPWTEQVAFDRNSGEQHPVQVPLPEMEDRTAEPLYVRASLSLPGLPGHVDQLVAVTMRHLLQVTVAPVGVGSLEILVENPSGAPFEGRIGPAVGLTRQPLHFREGETEKTMTLGGFEKSHANNLQFVIEEANPGEATWRRVATSTRFRFHILESFTGYEIDGTPPVSDYELSPDGDPKVASQLAWSIATPRSEVPTHIGRAARIDYSFDPGWKFLRFSPNGAKAAVLPGQPSALGAWVYGDGSGNVINARFTDSTGQTFQPSAGPMQWKGWRYLRFSLRGDDSGHWAGANDGIVHYPIHMGTLFLLDSAERRGGKGTVYVTDFTIFESP